MSAICPLSGAKRTSRLDRFFPNPRSHKRETPPVLDRGRGLGETRHQGCASNPQTGHTLGASPEGEGGNRAPQSSTLPPKERPAVGSIADSGTAKDNRQNENPARAEELGGLSHTRSEPKIFNETARC